MKIRLVQLNPVIGDIKGNTEMIREAYAAAVRGNADLVIFPELSVCGYPPMDLLERHDFIESINRHVEQLVTETKQTALLIGAPVRNPGGKGRPLYNAAILARGGKVLHTTHKTLLPTYDVFDEFRYFEPGNGSVPVELDGIRFGVTICEDIWNNENEVIYHVYDKSPAADLKKSGAEVLINISASPFTRRKPELREQMLRNHATNLDIPILYANQVGANTELVFDGDSMYMDANGDVLSRLPLFETGFTDIEITKDSGQIRSKAINYTHTQIPGAEERLFKALVLGLRDYLTKTSFASKALLGLSGGIDSALVSVIAAEALGPQNVLAVTMPSEFSSEGSVTDSETLAGNLGIGFEEIDVSPLYNTFVDQLEPLFKGTEFGVAEENIQSRCRGVLLMAISNKFGHILLNTGNKSEMAVGYCTLYGDMAGGLSILSDVYKTEVYNICRWLNESYYGKEVIPNAIITKPPSAELRPDQKDSDSLPDYGTLDGILHRYIEKQMSVDEVVGELGEEDTVKRIFRLVDLNEYKRRQAAPGLRVSSKAFGSGRRLPIVQQWTKQQG